MFTKQHYKAIAWSFKQIFTKQKPTPYFLQRSLEVLCENLQKDNPKFDKGKFIRACGFRE